MELTYEELLLQYKKKDGGKSMLTPLIEENKITLIHGESGAGKTIFILKHLNEHGIQPLLLDLDDNEVEELEALDCECDMIDGYSIIESLKKDGMPEIQALTGKVVIIDTWYLFYTEIGSEEIAYEVLKEMTKHNITVIIVAHTVAYSGKNDRPDIKDEIYKHIKGRLYIRKTSLKNTIEYHLIVEKIRGYKGDKILLIREDTVKGYVKPTPKKSINV